MIHRLIFLGLLMCSFPLLKAETAMRPEEVLAFSDRLNANYQEEEIIDRLKGMYCLVNMVIDADVIDQVKRFILIDRTSSRKILNRKDQYFPLIEKLLLDNNLPAEIKYIAAIESTLNPSAKSYMGAAGLWQLMPGTAKIRGLKIDDKIDQRLDPVNSTLAAIKYFKALYGMFGDWSLVMAAYNCGENKVLEAIEKSGSRDFWTIRKNLPRQTQLFVPAFIGVNYMMQYFSEHNLFPGEEEYTSNLVTFVKINKEVNIPKLLKKTSISKELFRFLNPSFRKNSIPKSESGHYVCLPDSQMIEFVEFYKNEYYPKMDSLDLANVSIPGNLLDLISFTRPFILEPNPIENLEPPGMIYNSMDYADVKEQPTLKVESLKNCSYHLVKTGESLVEIAGQYANITVQDLITWNSISDDDEIPNGTVLLIRS
jgi:membrane-bound lytic murein transglycosylase D